MSRTRKTLWGAALLALAGCAAPSQSTAPIGVATMTADRAIHLQLRAEGPGGTIGDALITYRPGEPRYEDVLHHLGGLEPGESKPVPPWPESER